MPDENKLAAFERVGMKLVRCCATCEHTRLEADWGDCMVAHYTHRKQGPKQLPAHAAAVCEAWELRRDLWRYMRLGDYADILPGPE
jgi:hypothetical protein